jgi:hypothetical protein
MIDIKILYDEYFRTSEKMMTCAIHSKVMSAEAMPLGIKIEYFHDKNLREDYFRYSDIKFMSINGNIIKKVDLNSEMQETVEAARIQKIISFSGNNFLISVRENEESLPNFVTPQELDCTEISEGYENKDFVFKDLIIDFKTFEFMHFEGIKIYGTDSTVVSNNDGTATARLKNIHGNVLINPIAVCDIFNVLWEIDEDIVVNNKFYKINAFDTNPILAKYSNKISISISTLSGNIEKINDMYFIRDVRSDTTIKIAKYEE